MAANGSIRSDEGHEQTKHLDAQLDLKPGENDEYIQIE
jgi:hypothetical protein